MGQQQLETYGRASVRLSAALRQFPGKMWLFKPSAEGWSIHEIILHLADSEVCAYEVCRRFIAEPDNPVPAFDVAQWARCLGYLHQSAREALEIIHRLRSMTYQVLVMLPEPVWEQALEHPKHGRLSLTQWIEIQERHIPHHVEQMKKNYEKWRRKNPRRKPAIHSSIDQSESGARYKGKQKEVLLRSNFKRRRNAGVLVAQ
ncbi:MAG TPA: DinB family protein [Candidatus Acidoferrum sp.]|nr:DinB family protein [Candidatus Acidoferrum sp.]